MLRLFVKEKDRGTTFQANFCIYPFLDPYSIFAIFPFLESLYTLLTPTTTFFKGNLVGKMGEVRVSRVYSLDRNEWESLIWKFLSGQKGKPMCIFKENTGKQKEKPRCVLLMSSKKGS